MNDEHHCQLPSLVGLQKLDHKKMMNLAEDVLGQILTAVIHMALLVIQFEGLRETLYPHTIMI